ncbi:MAG: lysophospholipid acyltransferase family protein [Victivallales bacterium]
MTNVPLSARRGNKFGISFFHWALKTFGINRPCEFVWAICLYYVLFDREAVKAAMPYVRRRFPEAGRFRRMWYVYRIFVSNGQAMVICAANVKGNLVSLEFEHFERAKNYLESVPEGMIIITSHFGNWQTAMTNLQNDLGRPISFLMQPEQNEAVLEALRHNPTQGRLQVISTDSEMGGMLEVMEAVRAGHVVCIMADRAMNDRTSEVRFLGEKAHFPYTAFFMAAKLNCPVIPLFVARKGKRRDALKVSFGKLIFPVLSGEKNAAEIMSPYVGEYARELENKAKLYPFQCFLFQDVWDFKAEKT